MKLFECIIDTGDSAIKQHLTANSKRELITANSWLGEFVRVTDITDKLFENKSMEDITLILSDMSDDLTSLELKFILAILADELNIP